MSQTRTTHCGCVEGAIGLLIGLALFAHTYAASPGNEPWLRTISTAIGFALGGAAIGKVLGLTWPRLYRLAVR
jgi:hypothetical protein